MKRSNFLIQIKGPEFSTDPRIIKASRFSIDIMIPSADISNYRKSKFRVEAMPSADGCLEFRVWMGDKFHIFRERIVFDLIDWSSVDGRKISKKDKVADRKKRELANRLLETGNIFSVKVTHK